MFSPEAPPIHANYVAAIKSIYAELSDREQEVLRFQFQQPGRTVTSQEIRDHFGYAGIAASNSLYGTVGKRFATSLKMETKPLGSMRMEYWKSLSTGDGAGEHFQWIMRPELASALIECGKVSADNDGIAIAPDVDIHTTNRSAVEGRRKLVIHLTRERNRSLVDAKKAMALSLACEVCGFDSQAAYSEDYCEVHHLKPLSEIEAESKTTFDDLAIVCANCHRVIHLYNPPLSMEELKRRISSR
jgi:predicted HNH restriction endonuclease